jgi:hypothetical protein
LSNYHSKIEIVVDENIIPEEKRDIHNEKSEKIYSYISKERYCTT